MEKEEDRSELENKVRKMVMIFHLKQVIFKDKSKTNCKE